MLSWHALEKGYPRSRYQTNVKYSGKRNVHIELATLTPAELDWDTNPAWDSKCKTAAELKAGNRWKEKQSMETTITLTGLVCTYLLEMYGVDKTHTVLGWGAQ